MEEKFGRLLFIVAFCQFHTYTCDLLALKSELDALAKCYEETTPSLFHTFVPNTTTTKKKKKSTLSTGLQRNTSYLVWSPCCPCSHTCPWVCRGSASECFITMGLHTDRVLFCSVPCLVGWRRVFDPSRPQMSSDLSAGKKALRKDGRKSLWHILHVRRTTMRTEVI